MCIASRNNVKGYHFCPRKNHNYMHVVYLRSPTPPFKIRNGWQKIREEATRHLEPEEARIGDQMRGSGKTKRRK